MRGSGGLTTTAHFQVPQLWEGATNGATGAGGGLGCNFSLPALLPSGGGTAADSRAERTEEPGAFEICALGLRVCASWH